jgi:hypothetical protein
MTTNDDERAVSYYDEARAAAREHLAGLVDQGLFDTEQLGLAVESIADLCIRHVGGEIDDEQMLQGLIALVSELCDCDAGKADSAVHSAIGTQVLREIIGGSDASGAEVTH